jgi:hypothetical protein
MQKSDKALQALGSVLGCCLSSYISKKGLEMKKKLSIILCLGLLSTTSECRFFKTLSRLGAALGISRNKIPDRYKPSETWLHPNTLFHGSSNIAIDVIRPKAVGNRCKGKPIVFATHHIALASLFMLKHEGRFACGRLPNDEIFYLTDNKRQCIMEDQGGAIYVVPASSFFCEAHVSLGVDEWISYGSISPLAKFEFPSALDAILDFGVKVYFVDGHTYARYWRLGSSDAEWMAFFKHLKPLTKEQLAVERAAIVRN